MTLKKLFAVTAGITVGVVAGIALSIGAYVWWDSRPKPRDSTSVTASFDGAYAQPKEGQTFVGLRYVLRNGSDADIRVSGSSLRGFVRRGDGSLFDVKAIGSGDLSEIDIPAHESSLWFLTVELPYEAGDGCKDLNVKAAPTPDDILTFLHACYGKTVSGFRLQSEDTHHLLVELPSPAEGPKPTK